MIITEGQLRDIIRETIEEFCREGSNGHSKGSGLDAKKIFKILKRNGYVMDHTKGDHYYWRHPDIEQSMFAVTYPYVNRMVWNRMVKEHHINVNI